VTGGVVVVSAQGVGAMGGGWVFGSGTLDIEMMQMDLLDFETSWLFFQSQIMGHSGRLACEATHVPAQ